MNNTGPVIIIEDDLDDQQLLTDIFYKLNYPNEVIFFSDGEKALTFLNKSEVIPFLILSDINLPKLDGLALRNKIKENAALQLKCIPYLLFTTSANHRSVIEAYSMSVQGFFLKDRSYAELEKTITLIMEYWYKCVAPNNYSSALRIT